MSDRTPERPAASVHRLEIVSRFFGDGYTAECSCGWRSEEMSSQDYALAKGREHENERLAPYREGFADALRWVLEHGADPSEIEEILDTDEGEVLPGGR